MRRATRSIACGRVPGRGNKFTRRRLQRGELGRAKSEFVEAYKCPVAAGLLVGQFVRHNL